MIRIILKGHWLGRQVEPTLTTKSGCEGLSSSITKPGGSNMIRTFPTDIHMNVLQTLMRIKTQMNG